MPPKRAIKKAKVKTQTFYEPYRVRAGAATWLASWYPAPHTAVSGCWPVARCLGASQPPCQWIHRPNVPGPCTGEAWQQHCLAGLTLPPHSLPCQRPPLGLPTPCLQFRPIPISLTPTDIQLDFEVMNALLVAQRAALKHASLEQAPAVMPATAAAAQRAAVRDGSAASDMPATSNDNAAQAQAAATAQQQWQYQQAAALAARDPPPNKLSSPSCTFQHQQAFMRQLAAGYAVA